MFIFFFLHISKRWKKSGGKNQNNITMWPNILEIDPVWSWGLLGTLGAGTIWLSQYFSDHHLTVECFLAWWWHEIGCRVLWQLMIYVPPFPVASLCSSSSSQVCCLEQWYDLCSFNFCFRSVVPLLCQVFLCSRIYWLMLHDVPCGRAWLSSSLISQGCIE